MVTYRYRVLIEKVCCKSYEECPRSAPDPFLYPQERGPVNIVVMEVSRLWLGLCNIYGFVIEEPSYIRGWSTAQLLSEPIVSGVLLTMSLEGEESPSIKRSDRALF